MVNIGITGSNGFVGKHLINFIQTLETHTNYQIIKGHRQIFESDHSMDAFISKCDILIHLAGINRSNDKSIIYDVNIDLAEKIGKSIIRTKKEIRILYASSTQEYTESIYGKAKKKARSILQNYAKETNNSFVGLIIPNLFGPFGKPFYNSVVATFCHQLHAKETPQIINDTDIPLLYVGTLAEKICEIAFRKEENSETVEISHTKLISVSKLLKQLQKYHSVYIEQNTFPELLDDFDLQLFNTFRSYIPSEKLLRKYKCHKDDRGTFIELSKSQSGGQSSFSTTKPGIIRGEHFHTRKIERFSIIQGIAKVSLRRIDECEIMEFIIQGEDSKFIDIPIWFTHNIENIGESNLLTCFWINESYNPENPDTYYQPVKQ